MVSFEELGIEKSIVKALKETGIEQPFPIQESIIPLILKGEDVIGRSNTGTGKTAAFVLPMLSKLNPNNFLQALEEFCKKNNIGFFHSSTAVPFEDLVLQYLRKAMILT